MLHLDISPYRLPRLSLPVLAESRQLIRWWAFNLITLTRLADNHINQSAQEYYGEQEHPAGHRKKHHQQQYEGEDGPGSQFENRSNEGGAYGGGGGGGYGGPPELSVTLLSMRTFH